MQLLSNSICNWILKLIKCNDKIKLIFKNYKWDILNFEAICLFLFLPWNGADGEPTTSTSLILTRAFDLINSWWLTVGAGFRTRAFQRTQRLNIEKTTKIQAWFMIKTKQR